MPQLLISSSYVYNYGFLDHPEAEIRRLLEGRRRVVFVPFAGYDHDGYTEAVRERLERMGLEVEGIRDAASLRDAEAVFVGGGNTFRLLKTLYERRLLEPLRDAARGGLPYIGSSAGSVITSPTIRTTNDMPIVQPPSFDSLGLIPFQLNCHYLDADPNSTHKGETREQRIKEFHEENAQTVIGLREGTMLRIDDGSVQLIGLAPARIFKRGQEPVEVEPGQPIDAFLS